MAREAVRRVLESFDSADVLRLVEHEAYGPSRVWSAGGVVMKVNPAADIRAEAWALRRARAAGVPVPEVLAEGEDDDLPGSRYLVMSFVEGDELAADSPLLPELGRTLRKHHSVQPPGFGRLDAPSASWFDWLLQRTEEHLLIHDEPGVRDLLRAWRERLVATPCALLHGDMQQCHVRVRGGVIAGIFDFESSLGGDPMWEFAHFCTGVGTRGSFDLADRMLPEVLVGYGAIDRSNEPLYRVLASLGEVASNITHNWETWIADSMAVLRERVEVAWAASAGGSRR